ncbi:hypothetical protein APED_19425 [Acanthopleuribacter pedis]
MRVACLVLPVPPRMKASTWFVLFFENPTPTFFIGKYRACLDGRFGFARSAPVFAPPNEPRPIAHPQFIQSSSERSPSPPKRPGQTKQPPIHPPKDENPEVLATITEHPPTRDRAFCLGRGGAHGIVGKAPPEPAPLGRTKRETTGACDRGWATILKTRFRTSAGPQHHTGSVTFQNQPNPLTPGEIRFFDTARLPDRLMS